ncbi:hypothetical protein ACWFRJ_34730 [Streptomyces sp. NPDC055239]
MTFNCLADRARCPYGAYPEKNRFDVLGDDATDPAVPEHVQALR